MKKIIGLLSFGAICLLLFAASRLHWPKALSQNFDLINQDYSRPMEVPENFLSFALDMGQVLGGKWWEGSNSFEGGRGGKRAKPFDFDRAKLDELIAPLAPFTLRLGGSEADSALYEIKGNRITLREEEIKRGFQTLLNRERVEAIKSFIERNNLELFFTLNIGPGYRNNGRLDYQALDKFLAQLSLVLPQVKLFELGNEINAFFLNYGLDGQINLEEYFQNYLEIKKLVKSHFPNAKLAGPANAFWPYLGEVFSSFTMHSFALMAKLQNELDIYTWHYYPSQSLRCPVALVSSSKEAMLEAIGNDSYLNLANSIVETGLKNKVKDIWLGETGPAQCGGEPGVSQSFESAMWFFDHIFKTLQSGQKKMIRQTLVGSDYGLINDHDLTVNYDYYVARIFRRINPMILFQTSHRGFYSFCGEDKRLYHAFSLVKEQEIFLEPGAYKIASLDEELFKSLSPKKFNITLNQIFKPLNMSSIKLKGKTINILKSAVPNQRCLGLN